MADYHLYTCTECYYSASNHRAFKKHMTQCAAYILATKVCEVVDVPGGLDTCRLDQVGYFPDSKIHHPFEFVHPANVIRAAYLIPRFCGGQTTAYVESTRPLAADDEANSDWKHYYVGRFVDHDKLMHFTGIAIGHMTHGDKLNPYTGLPTEFIDAEYEYSTNQEAEGVNMGREGCDLIDADEEMGDEGSGKDESDESVSDIDQVYSIDDDEAMEDINEDVSW